VNIRGNNELIDDPYAEACQCHRFTPGHGGDRGDFETLHPQRPQTSYLALAELGKAIKTIFLCRYLHSEAPRREIQEGLNVIENWNGANSFILYGKGGEIPTNDLENQELTMLALHLLQICLVYINTLMIQRVLTDPEILFLCTLRQCASPYCGALFAYSFTLGGFERQPFDALPSSLLSWPSPEAGLRSQAVSRLLTPVAQSVPQSFVSSSRDQKGGNRGCHSAGKRPKCAPRRRCNRGR
jgi:hypothetical protein